MTDTADAFALAVLEGLNPTLDYPDYTSTRWWRDGKIIIGVSVDDGCLSAALTTVDPTGHLRHRSVHCALDDGRAMEEAYGALRKELGR